MFYSAGKVVIFDTAAGRIIGAVSAESEPHVLLQRPAVMDFKYGSDGLSHVPQLQPIAYARNHYWVSWAGVRGHTEAYGEFLAAYETYLKETEPASDAG